VPRSASAERNESTVDCKAFSSLHTRTTQRGKRRSRYGFATEVAVLESSAGKIACLSGADILHPEYVRLALFAGAEIILNPTDERSDDRSHARHYARGARAWENIAVVATCAAASTSAVGRSVQEVWNHTGHLSVSGDGSAATALIDLNTLRTRRAEPWINFPAQLRTALYAREFERAAERARTSPGRIRCEFFAGIDRRLRRADDASASKFRRKPRDARCDDRR
jgi:hypothetical protein